MLAGSVRIAEFALVMLAGLTVYAVYVVPIEGFASRYLAAVGVIAVLATFSFQAADIYQVQAFRGYEKQYFRLASAWSVVFLIVIGISFFAKAGDQYSRIWLGSFYVAGLIVLVAFRRALFLLVRRWTRQGRLDRRAVIVGADDKGASLINAIAAQRDSDIRIIGAFDDRGDERSPTAVSGYPKLGMVDDLIEFARRTRVDLVIFSLPISANRASCRCSRSFGCCRSTSGWRRIRTSCAFVPAPIHTSATFRSSICSTSRSPTGTW